jgi:hypothetical protein
MPIGPVDGFEVTNSTVSGHGPGARGIVIWNGFKQNVTISNNAVSNNNCCGIELQDGSASGVTISDNILLGNGDNGISVVGLTSGAGANVISGNFLQDNGRFGIEIKNPMGTGLDNGDGSIVVENNTVELTALYVLGSPELRDRAGIAVFRRSPIFSDGNPNMPQGVIVRNNTVEGYKQPSSSEGFGIVAEGQGHIITNNTLKRNDVGLQFQMGHTPYTGSGGIPDAGDQSNIADQYFGRGNAPQSCGLVDGGQTNGTGLLANGTDFRTVGFGANFVQLNGRKVENTNTGMAYCSIQQAIDDNPTLNGHTIEVSAGTYVENVVVGKSVSILGPNATIDPCTGTRGAEAIVVPSTSAISSGEIFHVAASDVTIAGLTIDGDNTLISSGFSSTNGADIDAAEGITVYENNISNLTVQNNFIQNLSYFGVSLFGANYSAPETHGHVVSNNQIRNMGTYDALSGIANWGGGILLYNSQYTHVYENCIENARIGIQTGNFQKVNSGSTDFQLIENNTIEARALGIFYNLHNYSPFTIKDNTITALFNSDELPASTKSWKGLLIASLGNNMGLSNIVNNSVDGSGLTNAWTRGSEGINVWNVTNTARPIITEGTLTNVDKGIFVNNFEGYNSDGSYGSYADISKVTVSNADEGIVVYDSPNSTSHSSVNATAINNYISADTGIRLGETASGTVNGTFNENHITSFTTYAINSTVSNTVDATCNWYGTTSSNAIAAAITGTVNYILWLTSGTDDQPSTSGFQPLPTACSGTPVEITSTTPSPETCTHDNGSIAIVYSGGTADYMIAWSGPESGSDMTSANSYTIPTLVAGNYVINITDVNGSSVTTTVAVEYHPVTNQTTSSTYATIQAAIDAATAGDEIDVCAGTYVEHIKIDKAISLLGPNATIDACSGTRVPEAIIYPPVSDIAYNTDDGALIDVQASNVTISGFLLNGDNPDITTGFTSTNGADIDAASGIVRYSTGDNLVVTNNIIQNLSYFGVTLYDYPAGVPSAGNIIANNKIQDLGTYDAGSGIDYWGGGVLLYNNQYTYVHDNCMTNVRTGIQTGNYSKANPGTSNDQLITNNIMAVRRRGIFHNLAYSNASAYTLSNNTITGLMDSHETVWDGILLSSLSVPSTTSNNNINGAGITSPSEGIEVWNVKNNAPTAISGGNISGVSTGIFVNNYEGYSSNGADGAHAAVNGVTINATNIGVYLHDHPSSTHGQVSGSFTGCAITANEGIRTVESSSGATNGSFTGNTINADSLGINLTGMLLSSSNGLTIDDNTITLSDQIENTQPTVGIQLANLAGTAAATITNNDISGALYGYAGYNINTIPVSVIDGGTVSGIMQGISIINTDGVITKGSSINVKDVIMNGFTGTSSNPAINFHAGVYTFTTAGTTVAEGITMNIDGVTIDGTGKPSQASGGIYLADFSGGSTNVQTITVYNSTIQNNANRGFDARGKVNLALTANTISNNGHDAWGAGGNYGFSIIAQKEATVTAYNNFISLPASSTTEVYGLFTGNGTTNSITAHDNSILLNGNANSGSRLASSSAGTGSIDATCNWWGTVVVNDLASMISGNVTYTPWLINGTDDQLGTPGFQPVSGACSGIPIAVTVDGVIDALCTTGVNGTISITVTGGISPYTYLWSDGQTTEDAVNLAAGVYTVTVTDSFGNTGTASATVGASPVVNTTTMTGYSTIQGAINATNTVNGNTIVVCAGTYNENVVVNKELTINGAKAGVDPRPSTSSTRVIDDASESIVVAPKNKNIFKIESNNVTINGFEAKHSGGSGTADAFKASNSQTNIQILNNIVYQSTDEGIQLEGGTDYLVQYNYVKNPVGDGITFSSYSGTTPTNQPGTNLKIKDNDIEGSTSAYGSVYLYGVRNVTVSGNMITTRSSGIIVGSDGLPVSNALIHNNTINTEMHSAYSAYAMGIGIDGNGDNIQIHNNYIDDIGDGDLVHSNAYPDNFGLIYVGPSANANPTNVTVNNNYLYRFVDHNYLFVKGSVINPIDANCNYWSSIHVPTIKSRINGNAEFCTFIDSGLDSDPVAKGFQPAGSCVNEFIITTASLSGGPSFAYCYDDVPVLSIDFNEFDGHDWVGNVTVELHIVGADANSYNPTFTTTVADWLNGVPCYMSVPGFIGVNTITGATITNEDGCSISLNQNDVLSLIGTDQFTVNPLPTFTFEMNNVVVSNNGSATVCEGSTVDIEISNVNTSGTYDMYLNNVLVQNDLPFVNGSYSFTASLSDAGDYDFVITTVPGCTSTFSYTLNVNPLPTFTFEVNNVVVLNNGSATICEGSTVDIEISNVNTSGTYDMYLNNVLVQNDLPFVNGSYSFTASLSDAGDYDFVITTVPGCTSTFSYTLTVNPLPTFTFEMNNVVVPNNGSATVCEGSTVDIEISNVNTSGTYDMYLNNVLVQNDLPFVNGSYSFTASLSDAGDYDFVITTVPGCTSTFSYTLNVNPLPTFTFEVNNVVVLNNGSATICEGSTVDIEISNVNTSGTYDMYLNNVLVQNDLPFVNGSYSFTASLSDAGDYDFVITTVPGCTSTFSYTLTVNPLPTFTFEMNNVVVPNNGSATVCEGSTVDIEISNVNTSGTYDMYLNNVLVQNDLPFVNGSYSFTASLSDAGDYDFVITTVPGCTSTFSYTLTVNPLPTFTFEMNNVVVPNNGSATVCEGSTVDIEISNVNTSGTYDMYLNNVLVQNDLPFVNGSYSFTASLSDAGDYDFVITTVPGCTSTFSYTLTVNPLPTFTFEMNNVVVPNNGSATVCEGSSVDIEISNVNTSGTYDMYLNSVLIQNDLPFVNGSYNFTAALSDAGVYDIVITTTAGCTSTFSYTLNVNPLPTFTFEVNYVVIPNGGSETVCEGDGVAIEISNVNTSGTYDMYLNSVLIQNDLPFVNGSYSFTAALSDAGVYDIVITTTAGCTSTFSYTLKVNPLPGITCPPDVTVLSCDFVDQAAADAAFSTWLSQASASYGILTNNNTGAPNFCGGTTTVTFTSASIFGCGTITCDATYTITARPLVSITTDLQYAYNRCEGSSITLSIQHTGGCTTNEYVWKKDGLPVATTNVPSYTIPTIVIGDEGAYTVTINSGCGTPVVSSPGDLRVYAKPIFTVCPTNIVQGTDPSMCNAVVNYTTNVSSQIYTSSGTMPLTYSVTYQMSGATTGSGSGNGSGIVFNKGVTTVVVTAINTCGQATCTFTVTIADTELPTIACAANQTQTADAGACTAAVTVVSPTTSDNCGIASVVNDFNGTSDASGTYPIGTTTVIWTVTDNSGNTATCTQTITVTDNELPTIACAANQTQTADAGVCTAAVTVVSPTTNDNCGIASVVNDFNGTSDASGTYPIGTTTVIWTVTDNSGNTATCTQTITVTDDELPTIACAANQTQTADAGACTAAVTVVSPTTNDNCGIASVVNDFNGTSDASGTYPIGTTTVVWTVTDNSGNTATCTQTITVTDDELPTIACAANQTQTADAGVCTAAVTVVSPTTSDNCGIASVVNDFNGTSDASGTYPIGTTTVIWTVTDNGGNTATCTQTITVTDDELPTIACAANQTQTADAGVCTAAVTVVSPTTSDNCGIASVVNDFNGTSDASGTYPIGTTTVIWTVTDNGGNTATCTQTITVTDNELPTIACAANQTQTADAGACTAAVTVVSPTTSDNCGIASVVNDFNGTSDASGTYPIGTTTVIWTVTDNGGNTATCTQTITVTDDELPTIACAANQTQTADAGVCTAAVTVVSPTTSDNCGIASVVNDFNGTSDASGTYPIGTTTVIWTVTDNSGNTATCTQTITVTDDELPTIACAANQTQTADAGVCTAAVTVVSPTTSDNCGIASVVNDFNGTSDASGTYPIGTTTVIWTVTDNGGNTATCTQTITVTDDELPTISCVGNQTKDTDPAQCDYTVSGTEFDPTSVGDNCTGYTVSNDYNNTTSLNGAVFPKGTTTVTWTVMDASGNTATCSFTVVVNDIEDPVITCIGDQVRQVNNGGCTYLASGTEFDPIGFGDNCLGSTITNDFNNSASLAGAIFPSGNTTVTWTVTDASNNTTTCSFVVEVEANLQYQVEVNNNVLTDGESVEFCEGDQVTIELTGDVGATYVLEQGMIVVGSGSLNGPPNTFNITLGQAGVYTLTVTSINGCTSTFTYTFNVNPLPTFTFEVNSVVVPNNGSATVCEGSTVDVEISNVNVSGTYDMYLNNVLLQDDLPFSNGSYSFTASLNDAGSYDFVVTTTAGCTSTFSYTLNVNAAPDGTISGTATVPQYQMILPVVTFAASNGTLPYTFAYTINNGSVQYISTVGMNTSVDVLQSTAVPGVFTYELLSVTDANGCSNVYSSSNTATITVLALGTPDLTPSVQIYDSSFDPNAERDFMIDVFEIFGDKAWSSVQTMTIRISKSINYTVTVPGLTLSGTPQVGISGTTMIGSIPRANENGNWTFRENAGFIFIESLPGTNIDAFSIASLGLHVKVNNGTPANTLYPMTITIVSNSGGETNPLNNRFIQLLTTN